MSGWDETVAQLTSWEPPARSGRALVVVAHPDDESLALSGVVRRLVSAGWRTRLLCLTSGERAYPDLSPARAVALAARREAELGRAWAALGGADPPELAHLPDSGLAADEVAVHAAVTGRAADVDLLVGLWDDDPHPDHAVAGRAVLAAAAERPVVLAPVWARAWFTPAHPAIPWSRCRRVPLDDDARVRRRNALAQHATQLEGFDGHPPLMTPEALAVFAGDDVVVTGRAS